MTTVSISVFTISITLFGPSFTHSYIPLQQRVSVRPLAAVMRATISPPPLAGQSSPQRESRWRTVDLTGEDALKLALTHAIHRATH